MAKSQKTIERLFRDFEEVHYFRHDTPYGDDIKEYEFHLVYIYNPSHLTPRRVDIHLIFNYTKFHADENEAKKYLKGHDLTMNNLLAVLMRKYTEYWRNKE